MGFQNNDRLRPNSNKLSRHRDKPNQQNIHLIKKTEFGYLICE